MCIVEADFNANFHRVFLGGADAALTQRALCISCKKQMYKCHRLVQCTHRWRSPPSPLLADMVAGSIRTGQVKNKAEPYHLYYW